MSKDFNVSIKLPTAVLHIEKHGCWYTPNDDRDASWSLSLTKAEDVFRMAHRVVEALLEVEPGREASDWRTTREADPLPPSPAPSQMYCPFCKTPTCKCWDSHDCR